MMTRGDKSSLTLIIPNIDAKRSDNCKYTDYFYPAARQVYWYTSSTSWYKPWYYHTRISVTINVNCNVKCNCNYKTINVVSNLQNGSLIKVTLSIIRLEKHHTYSIHTFGSHLVLCMYSHGCSL